MKRSMGIYDTQHLGPRFMAFEYHKVEHHVRTLLAKGGGHRKHGLKLGVCLVFIWYIWVILSSGKDHRPRKAKIYPPGKHWTSFEDISTVVAFGDSWTSQAIHTCKNVPLGSVPNPANPGYPGLWTSANGPNWIGYLTNEFNESKIQLYNLAEPGATVTNEVVHGYEDRDLRHAVSDLTGFLDGELVERCIWAPDKIDSDHSLFTIAFGMNDVGSCLDHTGCNIYMLNIFEIFEAYKNSIKALYMIGARNFLLLNAPPTDWNALLDVSFGDPLTHGRYLATTKFNEYHRELAHWLRTEMEGTTVFELDLFGMFQQMHLDLKSLPYVGGYKDLYTFCEPYDAEHLQDGNLAGPELIKHCKGLRPEEYLWNSFFHVTWPAHKAIAHTAADIMSKASKKKKKSS